MRIGFIYQITCEQTGKKYVGQTRRKTIEQRWKEHIKYATKKSGKSKLSAAIRKYGAGTFSWVLLEECIVEQLNEKETYWIKTLDTLTNGYNLNEGGKAPIWSEESKRRFSEIHPCRGKFGKDHPAFGHKHTKEARRRIGDASRGRKRSKESIRKGAEKISGSNNVWFGKTFTNEHRQKIGAALKGKKRSAAEMKNCLEAAHSANRGRIQTAIERQRRSESLKGIPKTEEHRRNLSEAAKRRWAK